jgi:cation:H+ antiporter
MVVLQLLGGFLLLIAGAEVLVKGASKIAGAFGISPLVIGLTIVAFGTSSPELAVSLMSCLNGQGDIALGNVVGSNIFNVLFILGLASLFVPLVVAQQLIRLDVPIMIGASLLTLGFAWNGKIELWEGGLMVALGLTYTVFLIRQSRKEKNKAVLNEYREEYGEEKSTKKKIWLQVLLVVAGLAMLVLGSRFLVDSAVAIARSLGVSDLIIGLTIIAAGTSMPEVATSVIASIRGERDIAVGNVVGSNIFNLFIILGASALVAPGGVPVAESALAFDLPVMLAVAVACLPIFITGYRLDRWEGIVFLAYYVAYTTCLIMSSMKHASLEVFSNAMIWFVIPITLLTLTIVLTRELRKKRT